MHEPGQVPLDINDHQNTFIKRKQHKSLKPVKDVVFLFLLLALFIFTQRALAEIINAEYQQKRDRHKGHINPRPDFSFF
jgi:hypothetical protein